MDRMENSFHGIVRNVILCFTFNLEFTGLESFFLVPEHFAVCFNADFSYWISTIVYDGRIEPKLVFGIDDNCTLCVRL